MVGTTFKKRLYGGGGKERRRIIGGRRWEKEEAGLNGRVQPYVREQKQGKKGGGGAEGRSSKAKRW